MFRISALFFGALALLFSLDTFMVSFQGYLQSNAHMGPFFAPVAFVLLLASAGVFLFIFSTPLMVFVPMFWEWTLKGLGVPGYKPGEDSYYIDNLEAYCRLSGNQVMDRPIREKKRAIRYRNAFLSMMYGCSAMFLLNSALKGMAYKYFVNGIGAQAATLYLSASVAFAMSCLVSFRFVGGGSARDGYVFVPKLDDLTKEKISSMGKMFFVPGDVREVS